jgi:hypothetical protein
MNDRLIYLEDTILWKMNAEEVKVIMISRQTSTVQGLISSHQLGNVEYFKYLVA